MILPEWTTINIVLYTMLAILVLGVAPAELSGWSMMYYSKFLKDFGHFWQGRHGIFIFHAHRRVDHPCMGLSAQCCICAMGSVSCSGASFFERVLESLFLHRYSGPIDPFTTLMIAAFYSFCAGMIGWLNYNPRISR